MHGCLYCRNFTCLRHPSTRTFGYYHVVTGPRVRRIAFVLPAVGSMDLLVFYAAGAVLLHHAGLAGTAVLGSWFLRCQALRLPAYWLVYYTFTTGFFWVVDYLITMVLFVQFTFTVRCWTLCGCALIDAVRSVLTPATLLAPAAFATLLLPALAWRWILRHCCLPLCPALYLRLI